MGYTLNNSLMVIPWLHRGAFIYSVHVSRHSLSNMETDIEILKELCGEGCQCIKVQFEIIVLCIKVYNYITTVISQECLRLKFTVKLNKKLIRRVTN